MTSRLLRPGGLLLLRFLFIVGFVAAPSGPAAAQLRATLVAQGLEQPVAFAQDPSNSQIQLIAEQAGRIRVLLNGALQTGSFLDLRPVVGSGGERGLLGIAFAPDYAVSGRLFVNFTNLAGHTVIARFNRMPGNPLAADPSSRFDLRWPDGSTWITQPFTNHNGGHLVFGPDGYLYVGLGDGGGGNDPAHEAQNPMTLLGKMLRLDVSVPDSDPEGYDVPPSNPFVNTGGVLPEIWAFGLRNPWRYSFDPVDLGGTGALVIADVGQSGWEEVNYEPRLAGGRNYGWRNREGAHVHVDDLPPFSTPLIDPIFEYDHSVGRSITGGFVYRGQRLGGYQGRYFFGDIVRGRVWSLGLQITNGGEAIATGLTEHTAELGEATSPSSFGMDAQGELYVLAYGSGRVYRIDPASNSGGSTGTGCPSPDPFQSLGGGTCYNGGWFPPGYPLPSDAPASGGGTTPPSTGDCPSPDPFASMGGGLCVNGGWYPPDYPLAATPPSGGSSTPPPPSAGTGCPSPDPFAVMGGGLCVNGGWYPPDYPSAPPPPTGGSSGGSTPPPSTGCSSPDPFAILGGGMCVNGGWYPPGYPIPSSGGSGGSTPPPSSTACAPPDPFAEIGGGMCVNGGWLPLGYPTGGTP